MKPIVVVDSPRKWPLRIMDACVISARDYLSDTEETGGTGSKVFNLCRSYRYQSNGYYVSLLAEARGHRPLPSIETIQGLRLTSLIRLASRDIHDLIQSSLRTIRSDRFELSVYFGRNLARKYDRLSLAVFNAFPAPMLRVTFEHEHEWEMTGLRVIGLGEVPASHRNFLQLQAERYLKRTPRRQRRAAARYDLAILHDPDEAMPPSDAETLKKLVHAAEAVGIDAELIERDAYGQLGEYDALFIRTTTAVNHFTYRFARRAEALGMAVIDDPMSIVRCTNKVYLAEVMQRHRLRSPRTLIFDREGVETVAREIGFPCVLKQPDSSFSAGVVLAGDAGELADQTEKLFASTDLLVAQEFLRTDFDWRVGLLGGEPLYACRYFMADGHWQIIKRDDAGIHEGTWETVSLDEAPRDVLRLAARAGNTIGSGLYGVDIKVAHGRPYIIEVNDNPSIDEGVENAVIGDELYNRLMSWFLQRMEGRGR